MKNHFLATAAAKKLAGSVQDTKLSGEGKKEGTEVLRDIIRARSRWTTAVTRISLNSGNKSIGKKTNHQATKNASKKPSQDPPNGPKRAERGSKNLTKRRAWSYIWKLTHTSRQRKK